jgi:imidazolonepropionase-like amidohydrolase
MRTRVGVIVAALALAANCRQAPPPARADLILAHGTVVDPSPGSPPRVADVVVRDGVIVAVGEGLAERYETARGLDVADAYVIPGLADMHTHFGTGVRPPEQDDTTPVLARLLYYGVTTTLNAGSFEAWPQRIDALRAAMARGELEGPRLLAVGALITVPGSHPTSTIYPLPVQAEIARIVDSAPADRPIDLAARTKRATTLVRTDDEMRAEVERLGQWGADAIKLVVDSGPAAFGDHHPQMPRPMIAAAVQVARRFGIPVLCHVSSVDDVEACLASGASGVMHAVLTASRPPTGLEPRMAAGGMALVPTASLFDGWSRYPKNLSLLDDPFLAETITAGERAWLSSREVVEMFAGIGDSALLEANLRAHVKAAQDAHVLLVAGTDTGNPYRFAGYALHEELAFYQSSGLTPREALATATINAARLVGDENEWGAVRPGLSADLVVLDANPLDDINNTRRIRYVIRAGRVVDRAGLPVH